MRGRSAQDTAAMVHLMRSPGLDLQLPRKQCNLQGSPLKVETDLTFVGLVGIIDPPRPECDLAPKFNAFSCICLGFAIAIGFDLTGLQAIQECRLAGISDAQLKESILAGSILVNLETFSTQPLRVSV